MFARVLFGQPRKWNHTMMIESLTCCQRRLFEKFKEFLSISKSSSSSRLEIYLLIYF